MEPLTLALTRHRLRDYPLELAVAESAQLKAWFDSPRQLIANLLYQAVRYRQLGIAREYGDTTHGFWYVPVSATLYRAGFSSTPHTRWLEPGDEVRSLEDELNI